MGYASQPETAGPTSSGPVRQPKPTTLAGSMLEGHMPLTKFGSAPQPTGNPHVKNGMGFTTPSHGSTLLGGAMGAHVQNPEQRNPMNGVPHISMKPGKM